VQAGRAALRRRVAQRPVERPRANRKHSFFNLLRRWNFRRTGGINAFDCRDVERT
jgi:hypothetical protein